MSSSRSEVEFQLAAHFALDGRDVLLPTIEDDPDGVWADEGVPAPGYYVKRRLPRKHRFLQDGRSFALEFHGDRGEVYRIQCNAEIDIDANAERVAEIYFEILRWIDDGVVSVDTAFAAFERTGDEWWRVLRVPPDATRDEIDAGYRRQALVCHPDHGGTSEAFRRLREAYEQATC